VPADRHQRIQLLEAAKGVETNRFGAHIRCMSTNRYEILDAGDGTLSVEISGGVGEDAAVTGFATQKDAEDFVAEERRKLGVDGRWQPIDVSSKVGALRSAPFYLIAAIFLRARGTAAGRF
jgi:hypothetical protein